MSIYLLMGSSGSTLFSSVFDRTSAEIAAIVSRTACPSLDRVRDLLAKGAAAPLTLAELAELLAIGRTAGAEEQFEALRAFVIAGHRKPRGNTVRYVAPIYVSSFCVDTCAYCNFSARRKTTVRKRLDVEELRGEIAAVMSSGARVIELVYGSDPELTTDSLVRDVRTVAEALRGEPGSGVLLCTEYLSRDAYDALHDAGLWGIVQWDETLDARAYEQWHSTSPRKREFGRRMDNHDRARAAGLEVAIGALFGLADYRYDTLMQVAKARHLAARYGSGPFVFGVPRLKPIAGHELHFKTEVPDRAYETALLVYRLAAPESGRWLQTRETFAMNLRNLLDGDVFTYRCGEVKPGGYGKPDVAAAALKGGQFGVNELQGDLVERELASRQFRILYAWMPQSRAGSAPVRVNAAQANY